MRKLSLAIADIHVESYPVDEAPYAEGTIAAFQTEPASNFNPCTGASCTYPVQLCRTCHCAADERPDAERRQEK